MRRVCRDTKEGGRPGPLNSEGVPRIDTSIGRRFAHQGAGTAPFLGDSLRW